MTKSTNQLTGFRKKADVGLVYTAMLFALLGLVQIFLAGAGVFGHDFDMHVTLGRILSVVALLVLVLAVVARPSKSAVVGAVVLVVLAAGATSAFANLGWDSAWLGGLHALSGIVAVIIADSLGRRAFKKAA